MQINSLRKTHPLMLIMAVAITVFSLLVSAAITELIPDNSHQSIEQSASENAKNTAMSIKQLSVAGNVPDSGNTSTYLPGYKSRIQPKVQLNPRIHDGAACTSCGEIVSINPPEQEASGYVIRIRMKNGSYRTVTQYSKPHFSVGDKVNLSSGKYMLA